MNSFELRSVEAPGWSSRSAADGVEQDRKDGGMLQPAEVDEQRIVMAESSGNDGVSVGFVHGVSQCVKSPHSVCFRIEVRFFDGVRKRWAECAFRDRFPGSEDFDAPVIVIRSVSGVELD